jgi:glucan phosphoethanolaminetransferase (alkaline phosphatase superfamily)
MFMSLPGSALPSAFERLVWYDTLPVQLGFIFTASALLASSFTVWPFVRMVVCVWRRLRGKRKPAGPASRSPALAAAVTGLLVVVFFAGLDQMLGNSQYRLQMAYGMTPEMVALLWIPLLVGVLACFLAWFSFISWRRRQWSLPMRVYYSLLALAAALVIPFCWNWNLIGFQY